MYKKHLKSVLCALLGTTIAFSTTVTAFASEDNSNEILSSVKMVDGQAVLVKNENIKSDKLRLGSPLLKSVVLPSSYNLVDEGCVSSIKKQNPYGTCWAFSDLASLESNIIRSGNAGKDIDLSEKHLINFNYNGADSNSDKSLFAGSDTYSSLGYSPFQVGGNSYMTASTLMRRYGAVDEEKAPYEFSGGTTVDSSLRTASDIYLKDAYFLPETVEFEHNDYGEVTSQKLLDSNTVANSIKTIKQFMMEYGAVSSSYYCSDAMSGSVTNDKYWNSANNSYYFNAETSNEISNHGITLVGWDDNYSKNNFTIAPPADGAWIVKNSWGSNWGNDGYFYLSYYDLSISNSVVFIAEDAKYKTDGSTVHEYENIYQYDGVTFGDAQIRGTGYNYSAANFFTARDNEILEAISTCSTYENITVNYEIYTDVTSTVDPTKGTLAAKGSKSFELAGYYTIPLDEGINLDKGEKYSVVIKISFNSNGYNYTILPCEIAYGGYSEISVLSGQSSYCSQGTWRSITSSTTVLGCNVGNAIVKAYTNDILYGDVDSDGSVTVKDATLLQKYLVSVETLSEKQLLSADADKNGNVDIKDSTLIQKISASLI